MSEYLFRPPGGQPHDILKAAHKGLFAYLPASYIAHPLQVEGLQFHDSLEEVFPETPS